MSEKSSKVDCGLDYFMVPCVSDLVLSTQHFRFDFCVIPLVHPRFKREFLNHKLSKKRIGAFTRTDLVLTGCDWSRCVYGKLSKYINVDCSNLVIRKLHEAALEQEINWASYLLIRGLILPLPTSGTFLNLARIINSKLKTPCTPPFIIKVPMVSPLKNAASYRKCSEYIDESMWERWNTFRTLCDTDDKLSVALEISEDLPGQEELDRWKGECVKMLILKAKIFVSNNKGNPILPPAHREFVKSMIDRVSIVITDVSTITNIEVYSDYLNYLPKLVPATPLSLFAQGYEDFLQCPLQPLMDNLQSQTYEGFEKDPVKYSQYELAIYKALLDKHKNCDVKSTPLVVMIVGAGRGPIVSAALNASRDAKVPVKVYAVDKNPNAIVSLQMKKLEEWHDRVTVVHCDMREWQAPEKADILVSELLGSFGDNELSPECLDGVQHHLKSDGISIPKSYTSYVCPIQSPKLYRSAKSSDIKDRPFNPFYPFEQLYVVYQTTVYRIAPVKEVFTFTHPVKDSKPDNSRHTCLEFTVENDCVLHGFSGYFEATLYDDITISIVPDRSTDGLYSWFSIYIPIREPIILRKADKLVFSIWRLVSRKDVWYEWCVESPVPLPIHNPNGRSYAIGLI